MAVCSKGIFACGADKTKSWGNYRHQAVKVSVYFTTMFSLKVRIRVRLWTEAFIFNYLHDADLRCFYWLRFNHDFKPIEWFIIYNWAPPHLKTNTMNLVTDFCPGSAI